MTTVRAAKEMLGTSLLRLAMNRQNALPSPVPNKIVELTI
jgi:hypothetical protein